MLRAYCYKSEQGNVPIHYNPTAHVKNICKFTEQHFQSTRIIYCQREETLKMVFKTELSFPFLN